MYILNKEIDHIDDITVGNFQYKEVHFKPTETKVYPPEVYSQLVLDSVSTEEPLDDTSENYGKYIEKRNYPVIAELQLKLLEHNIRIKDIKFIAQTMVNALINQENIVYDKLWGAEDQDKTIQQLDKHYKS